MKNIVLLLVLLFVPSISCAASPLTNMEMGALELDRYLTADKEMDVVFKRALEKIRANQSLSPEFREEWIREQELSQRAWVEFRDHEAKVIEHEWFGGSGMGAARAAYLRKLTEDRIAGLKEMYDLK